MAQTEYLQAFCPECGSNVRIDRGRKKQLVCTNCKYTRNLSQNSDQVVNRGLSAGVNFKKQSKWQDKNLISLQCNSCKSILVRPKGETLTRCPFCRGEDLVESAHIKNNLEPIGIIPFNYPRKKAVSSLMRHLSGFFLAEGIRNVARHEEITGVYIPFFLADSFVRSSWQGELAHITKRREDGKMVDKTVWDPTRGYREHFYDNFFFPVPATNGLKIKEINDIGGFDLFQVVGYDPRYLRDFCAECYQKKEMDGLGELEKKINDDIQKKVTSKFRNKDNRKLQILSEKTSLTFKHILLPVWITSFTYKKKNFIYVINGQNGRVIGKQPLSFIKMYIATGLAVLLIILLVLLLG